MLSPYPLVPTLRLPFDYARPSVRVAGELECAQLAARLLTGPPSTTVKVLLAGDLMRTPGNEVPAVEGSLRDLLAVADLVVANCEGPVSPEPSSPWELIRERLCPGYLTELLASLGVTPARCVLSVANNHSGDRGRAGLEGSVDRLSSLGVTVAGLTAAPMVTVSVGGLRIGVVGWTDLMNGRGLAPGGGVARTRQVEHWPWSRIRRATGHDCLLGSPHWGVEFRHFPEPRVQELARSLVAGGFDLLAGHHPHVLQPVELSGRGLIAYSLGNLVGPAFPMSWPMRLGALLEVDLEASGEQRGRVVSYRVHPCVQLQDRKPRIVPLKHAPEPLRERVAGRLRLLFPERC
jgi:hypothetical protein